MTPGKRWQRIEDLARRALEWEGEARSAFLEQACGDDKELIAEAEKLALAYELARRGRKTVLARPGFVPPPSVALEPGLVLGNYLIVDRIATGSMTEVYRAQFGDEETVAVKVAQHGFDAAQLERQFQVEQQMLRRLDHPNIARFFDCGALDDGRPYMVTEYVEGLAIHQHCQRYRLDVSERIALFREVCAAVHHAHQNRVIHRDIKPSNVLVDTAGVPKLLDFGIAVELEQVRGGEGSSPERWMTPSYASPEQIRGGEITPLSDIYSLGVLLYELLTGRLPYGEDVRGPREMARLLEEHRPAWPSEAVADPELKIELAGKLDLAVVRAISQEPVARYPSALDFAAALSG